MDPFIVYVQHRNCLVFYQWLWGAIKVCSAHEMSSFLAAAFQGEWGVISYQPGSLQDKGKYPSCFQSKQPGCRYLSVVPSNIRYYCFHWIPLDLAPPTDPEPPHGFGSFLASLGPLGTRHWLAEVFRQGFQVGEMCSWAFQRCSRCSRLEMLVCPFVAPYKLRFVIALPANENLPHISSRKVFK